MQSCSAVRSSSDRITADSAPITTAVIAEGLRRTALPFAVSALAQKAAIASLDAGEEMEARVSLVKQERARMAAELEAQGWTLQPSQGNFLWIRADGHLLARLVDAFYAAGIVVRAYQGDGVRITVANPASNNRVLRLLAAHAA
ncbi:aminotransferase class I/II-fold pyridoxal phosphate-dependent enzyme [Pseudarthrobacter oxydans]